MKKRHSFCWWCGRRLVVRGGKTIEVVMKDQIGNEVHVHKYCSDDAKKFINPFTAQEKETKIASRK